MEAYYWPARWFNLQVFFIQVIAYYIFPLASLDERNRQHLFYGEQQMLINFTGAGVQPKGGFHSQTKLRIADLDHR